MYVIKRNPRENCAIIRHDTGREKEIIFILRINNIMRQKLKYGTCCTKNKNKNKRLVSIWRFILYNNITKKFCTSQNISAFLINKKEKS